MPQPLQPLLHELVTVLAAPTQVLSDRSGRIRFSPDRQRAEGLVHADVRVLAEAELTVDGEPGDHLATTEGSGQATFTYLLRHVGQGLVPIPDPQVRLDRHRRVEPGVVSERLVFSSLLPMEVPVTVRLRLASDLTGMEHIKVGDPTDLQPFPDDPDGDALQWGADDLTARLRAPGAELILSPDRRALDCVWSTTLAAAAETSLTWSVTITDQGGAVIPAPTPALPAADLAAELTRKASAGGRPDARLQPWLERSLADLNALRMSTPESVADSFFAAGAPWYLTLFGRDSIWAARMLLPVDVGPAVGTLKTLARLQGTKIDVNAAEQPGKIMHELRRGEYAFGDITLPPLYYGTIDATPLWICLLHDAWRAGAPEEEIRALLPALRAALEWLVTYADADGDGFCEYIDESGHGLANQGWKDSGDSIRFADGRMAEGSVALCEVQGYAYEAAIAGATLLDRFDEPGAGRYRSWAVNLAERFRESFWCESGTDRYPALALDGTKQRVDSVTSNIGHLLGTGLLDATEEALVARRVTAPDLDSGLGLRTMSADAAAYSPLSYHCGTVWPHDTAIVIEGLVRCGHGDKAAGLIEGLLRASVAFGQRFPELWSGEGRPVPYAAACRPQAWSAAAAVTVAHALAG